MSTGTELTSIQVARAVTWLEANKATATQSSAKILAEGMTGELGFLVKKGTASRLRRELGFSPRLFPKIKKSYTSKSKNPHVKSLIGELSTKLDLVLSILQNSNGTHIQK